MTDSEARLRELGQEEEVNVFLGILIVNTMERDFATGLKLINLAAVLSHKNVGKYNKKLIRPTELIHPEIDEMSVMTYLSQFPTAKLIDKTKLPPEHSGSFEEVDEWPIVNVPTEFIINITGGSCKPQLLICDFDGNNLYHTVTMKNPNSFIVKYIPERVGPHKLILNVKDIVTGDITSIKGSERRIQRSITKFKTYRVGITLKSTTIDDGSYLNVKSLIREDRFIFEYTPLTDGEYEVNVMNNRRHVGQSPYKVNVSSMTTSRVRAFGPGLEGGMAEHQSIFNVETNGDTDSLGIYKVNVLSCGEHIPASPFVVMVDAFNPLFHPTATQVYWKVLSDNVISSFNTWPSLINDDIVKTMIEQDPFLITSEIAEKLYSAQQTISDHIWNQGLVYKYSRWVPLELSEKNLPNRVVICTSLLTRNKNEPFLDRMITDDEKWITYENTKKIKTEADVNQALLESFTFKHKTFFKNRIYKLPSRWQEVISNDGNYIVQ
uniref:Structural protein n=1 Tax=Heterorhabditis bacteriophora TaxID=37862 RepID=A0A1I7X8A1_HETBA